MTRDDIQNLLIYEVVSGSQAYGTSTPESDVDYRGIFKLSNEEFLTLPILIKGKSEFPLREISSEDGEDSKYFELRKFLQMAGNCSPICLELLFTPKDFIKLITPIGQELINHRNIFITKKVYYSFVEYAVAQIKRAKGQNKWINCRQPETPPNKLN